jgi:3-hydroxy acid dehydrogenase / malonic semialdehyde reductase
MASRLADQIVFITGASAGIGAACARAFAAENARLILAARRLPLLQALEPELRAAGAADVKLLALDVRDADAVNRAVEALPPAWRSIEVLVNNAGLSRGLDKLHEGNRADWDEMIDTNVKGVLHVNRAVVPLLVARGRGTVIHLGSIAGRQLYPGGNVYCASKHAVRAINEGLRLDVLGTGVRVATVDPGLVAETEFSLVRFHGDAERAGAVYRGLTPLTPDDVAELIVYVATRPPHVNIAETIILPTDQASATNVNRRNEER